MAKGYFLDETIGFVIEYLQDFHHVRRKIQDAYEEEGVYGEVVEGATTKLTLDPIARDGHINMLSQMWHVQHRGFDTQPLTP